jgi:hypothetical protein
VWGFVGRERVISCIELLVEILVRRVFSKALKSRQRATNDNKLIVPGIKFFRRRP